MKALALASLIAASAGTGVAVGGPIFFGYTQPFAIHQPAYDSAGNSAWQPVPNSPQFGNNVWSLSFGASPDSLVITDVSFGQALNNQRCAVWIAGQPAFEWSPKSGVNYGWSEQELHLQHGIPVPAGATIELRDFGGNLGPPGYSVSLSGYKIF